MTKYLIILIYFFSFIFFAYIQIEKHILVSASFILSIIALPFLYFRLFNSSYKIELKRREWFLIILIVIYIIYTTIVGMLYGLQNLSIYKVMFNNVFLLLYIALVLSYSNYTITFTKIKKLMCYSAIFIGILGIILYCLNISSIIIKTGFPFIEFQDMTYIQELADESRYQYTFTHKIRYAYYCLLMIYMFFINNSLTKWVKTIGILLMIVNIFLSNSATALIGALLIVTYFVSRIKVNKYLKFIFYIFTIFIFFITISHTLEYISMKRDISTLGYRTLIWEGVIEEIKKNPFGVIDHYSFHNFYYYKVPFVIGSAHSVFLGEFLDYGFIGGGLFLLVYISYIYNLFYENKNNIILMLSVTIMFMMDIVLGREGFPIFFLSYLILKKNIFK